MVGSQYQSLSLPTCYSRLHCLESAAGQNMRITISQSSNLYGLKWPVCSTVWLSASIIVFFSCMYCWHCLRIKLRVNFRHTISSTSLEAKTHKTRDLNRMPLCFMNFKLRLPEQNYLHTCLASVSMIWVDNLKGSLKACFHCQFPKTAEVSYSIVDSVSSRSRSWSVGGGWRSLCFKISYRSREPWRHLRPCIKIAYSSAMY